MADGTEQFLDYDEVQLQSKVEKISVEDDTKLLDVPFDLGLSEKEKATRANLNLDAPFAKAQQGTIYYEPDLNDDFDDEDPDADLEI